MGGITMAWVVVHKNRDEGIFKRKPRKTYYGYWVDSDEDLEDTEIELPKGSIKKLIGRDLTWEDEPVELKEE